MSKINRNYFSFLGGEVSRNLFNRIDMQQNAKWFETAKNIYFDNTGCFFNRRGFKRIGASVDNGFDKNIKLVPFVFNREQSYVIEIGQDYFRIIKNGFFVKNKENKVIKIKHSIPVDKIEDISYSQIGDILYLATGGHSKVKTIKRFSETEWTCEDFDYEIPPMMPFNDDKSKTIQFASDSTTSSTYFYRLTIPNPNFYNYFTNVSISIYNRITGENEIIFSGNGNYNKNTLLTAFNNEQLGEHNISASLEGSTNVAKFLIPQIEANIATDGEIKYSSISISISEGIYKKQTRSSGSISISTGDSSWKTKSFDVSLPNISSYKVTSWKYRYGTGQESHIVSESYPNISSITTLDAVNAVYNSAIQHSNKISKNGASLSSEMSGCYNTSAFQYRYNGVDSISFEYYVPEPYNDNGELVKVSSTDEGTGLFYATANFDFFKNLKNNEYFSIKTIYSATPTGEEGQNKSVYISEVAVGETITAPFWSNGSWRIVTSGLFDGIIKFEYSYDGKVWHTHRTFSSNIRKESEISTSQNYNEYGNIDVDDNILIRLRINANRADKFCITFDTNSFENIGYFKIIEKQNVEIDGNIMENRKAIVQCVKYNVGTPKQTFEWANPSWSEYAGYPKVVFVYQNRLGFASTPEEPQNIWFSKTDDFKKYDTMSNIRDTDAITISALKPKGISDIVNVSSVKKLFIFTSDYEFAIKDEDALTQKNKQLINFTSYGSEPIDTQVVSNRLLFIEKGGTAARELSYNIMEENYDAKDITIFFKHLLNNNRIITTSYIGGEYKTYLMLTEDGTIICYKYMPEHEIAACSKFVHSKGKITNILCINGENSTHELYIAVDIEGKKYIECILTNSHNNNYLDSREEFYSEEPISEVQTNYYGGGDVFVITDNGTEITKIENDGKIKISRQSKNIVIGFPVISEATLIPPSIFRRDGSSLIYNKKNICKCHITFSDSYGFKIGIKGRNNFKTVYNISNNEAIDNEVAQTSGKKDVVISSSYNDENMLSFVQELPYKMEINNVELEVDYGGK